MTHSVVSLLQWGRNLIVAEGTCPKTGKPLWLELQWGRNLIVAEGGVQIVLRAVG